MKKFVPIILIILLCGCVPYSKAGEYTETRLMMDTVCTIRAGGDTAEAAVLEAFDRIAEIEYATDYYSQTSEVSAINRAASGEEISISEDMLNILKTALDVCEKSNGAFDITVAPLKDLWGISEGNHEPPSDAEIKGVLKYVDYRNLTLDVQNKTLTKEISKCKIDLGGAAKGYAADCAAEVLKEWGCEYAVIDLGGNVYVFGRNPVRADGNWIVGIQKPFGDSGEYSQMVKLSEGAVVTAGSYQRYFEWQGKRYHHILDTKTGHPSDSGILGASIKSTSALEADCLSTACMVLGGDKGEALTDKFNASLITQ